MKTRWLAHGPSTANSPPMLTPDGAATFSATIWHIGPIVPSEAQFRKIERSAEKRFHRKSPATCCPVAAFTHHGPHCLRHRPSPPSGRMCSASDTPSEARAASSGTMVAHVRQLDPQFFRSLWPLPSGRIAPNGRMLRQQSPKADAFAREFDTKLDGRTSRLVDYSPNAPSRHGRNPTVPSSDFRNSALPATPKPSTACSIPRAISIVSKLSILASTAPHDARLLQARQLQLFAKKSPTLPTARTSATAWSPASRPLLTLADNARPRLHHSETPPGKSSRRPRTLRGAPCTKAWAAKK